MYNLSTHERAVAAEAAAEAARKKKPTRARRDRQLHATYGFVRDELAQRSHDRRDEWVMQTMAESTLELPAESTHPVHHRFRDRTPSKELGPANGHVSARTFVPRTYFRGGGAIDFEKNTKMRAGPPSARVVNSLAPTEASSSVFDAGSRPGRIQQPLFDRPNQYLLRAREPEKELHRPMYYSAKNELERVNESLAQNAFNDYGTWHQPPQVPEWRERRPAHWLGGTFRNTTAPADNALSSVDGAPYPISVKCSESAAVHPGSIWASDDKAGTMRDRDKRLDLAGEFQSAVPRTHMVPSAQGRLAYAPCQPDLLDRKYHKSICESGVFTSPSFPDVTALTPLPLSPVR